MEALNDAKKLIFEAKNICIIPSQTNEPESLTSALALFYTLKELGKNVNLIIEYFPEKLGFLIPSTDFISQPKNFVISIPRSTANISQIYYEKNEENLKIHLTINKGRLKKDNISFYFEDAKPDAVITLGIKDLQQELLVKLDSFGFLLDTPIINIDCEQPTFAQGFSEQGNKKFGQINVIENKSLSEIILQIIKSADQNAPNQNAATAILAGLMIYYENFKSPKTNPEVFALASDLIKKGALHQQIIDNLYKTTQKEMQFLSKILQNMTPVKNDLSVAILDSNDFESFSENEASVAVEKVKTLSMQDDVLVLWKSHSSTPSIKGFFYSKKPNMINKFSEYQHGAIKRGWVFLAIQGEDLGSAKDQIINLLRY